MAEKETKQTMNMKEVNEALHSIKILTDQFSKKRMTTANYQKEMTEQLIRLDSKRDYMEYLRSIGQHAPSARG